MAIDAIPGPQVIFNTAVPPSTGLGFYSESNPDVGPSLDYLGRGYLDPRFLFSYEPGQSLNYGGAPAYGWGPGFTRIPVLDVVPATATVASVVPAAHPVAATAMTLISSTTAGNTVGNSITNSLTGAKVTGLVAIGGAAGTVSFGSFSGAIQWYDPTKAMGRLLAITQAAGGTAMAVTIKGYDIYGFPMTETITTVAGAQTAGLKAWKYVASVTPATSDGSHNISVDTIDTLGFPLFVGGFPYVEIWNASANPPVLVTATTGFTAGVTTTATATTGDVRGTFALQNASNGTLRTTIFVTPSVANLNSNYTTGLVGVAQF